MQELRPAIGEALAQVPLETGGIFVEEGPHIGGAHGVFRLGGPEPGEPQAGTEGVIRIEPAGCRERRQGFRPGARLRFADAFAGFAEEEPRRREPGREFQCLAGEVGCGRPVALVEGGFPVGVAAVGEEIARAPHQLARAGTRRSASSVSACGCSSATRPYIIARTSTGRPIAAVRAKKVEKP